MDTPASELIENVTQADPASALDGLLQAGWGKLTVGRLLSALLLLLVCLAVVRLLLGMTRRQIFFQVTLLQMVKHIVPPMSNEIITLVKDTSLARVIALQEIIWMGESFLKGNQGYAGLVWPLFFTAVYYLAFSGLTTILLNRLEKKLEFFR